MTRFTSSRTVERSFTWRPYAIHPGRRRHIFGELQPLHVSRIPWAKLITGAVWVVCATYAAKLWIIGG